MNRVTRVAPPRVLVVDDFPDTVESIAFLLDSWGYATATARDGLSALAAADVFRPDVVLLDIGLPVIDGYEVARRIRRTPALADVYLVCITGYGREADRLRAAEAGFDEFLVKPIEPALLRRLLACRRGPGSATVTHSLN